VQVFNVETGSLLNTLKSGHYDTVNACEYVAPVDRLFTAGSDGAVLVWEPWLGQVVSSSCNAGAAAADGGRGEHRDNELGQSQGALDDVDTWSDDDLDDLF
jgi:hypothetical protein